MAATDKHGQPFVEGKKVRVSSDGRAHPGGDNPAGAYEGTIVGVHEDGPHVLVQDGTSKDGYRTTPFAADCEVLA